MKKAYFLSESDRNVLRDQTDQLRKQPRNTVNRPDQLDVDSWVPECYLVIAPAGGVPPRIGLTCGVANDCQVYRINPSSGHMVMEPVDGLRIDVLNVATAAIPAGSFVIVQRDKYGYWFPVDVSAEELGTGTGSGTHVPFGTGTGSLPCSKIPGINFDRLPIETSKVDYVLGLWSEDPHAGQTGTGSHTASFCLVRIPVARC